MNIAIIGAGIIGLSTAVRLADAGHAVTVFDPVPVSGATAHAGGMLAPAAEVVYGQELLFPIMKEAKELYPELVELVAKYSNKETGFNSHGTIVVGADRADTTHLHELYNYQVASGMTVEKLTVSAARSLEPALSTRLAGAVRCSDDWQVIPTMFAEALIDTAHKLGVSFIAHKVYKTDKGVVTADKSYTFDQVIWAAGLDVPDLPLRPVYGEVVRVKVPDAMWPLTEHVVRAFVEDRPVYIIPRVDKTIAIGATSRENHQEFPPVECVWQLLRDANRVVPGIIDCGFLGVTTGARPGTPDDLPFLGRKDEHTVVSTGYFRHGILLAPFAAKHTLDIINGEDGPASCRLDRF
ncbi:MAG: glycine oxidase ThiO [Corynebacterium sp.]|nr:glycine oxidase ThiO [Corynebacterium sp.]